MRDDLSTPRPGLLRCQTCAARENGFCALLGTDRQVDFAARSYRVQYEPGQKITVQGRAAERVGVIGTGVVRMLARTAGGTLYPLQLLHDGQIIAEPEPESHWFACEAASAVDVCWMPGQIWGAFLRQHSAHLRAYLSTMARQVEDLRRGAAIA